MPVEVGRGSFIGGYYRASPFEMATNYIAGFEPVHIPADAGQRSARQRFEEALLEALQRPPCVVAFSGGRDSSAILAVAAHVAAREGLSPPIAATHDFSGDPWADESEWQELVIRHVGVQDWVRLRDPDAFEILGERARAGLLDHGVLYPAMLYVLSSLGDLAASGGTLVTGQGGDEVLGFQRMTGLNFMLTARPRPNAEVRALLSAAVTPRARRRAAARRAVGAFDSHPWLAAPLVSAYQQHYAEDTSDAPLRWDRAVERHGGRRNILAGRHNLERVMAPMDVTVRQPFLDPAFLGAFASTGGVRGFLSRTSMMRMLFHDLLPDAVLSRTTKGEFSAVAFGLATRHFMEEWRGDGLGELAAVVDWRELRAMALSEQPVFGAQLLVQHVWLESQGQHAPSE